MATGTFVSDELSVDLIVATAVEMLDEEGIEAFSMRALARRLGRSNMAPYRHVASREVLLQLAADSVQGDFPEVRGLPWYERLATFTRHRWFNTWRVHPWVVDYVGTGRISPQSEASGRTVREVLRDAGFGDEDAKHAVLAHWAFIQGTLRFVQSSTPGAAPLDPVAADAIFEFNLRTWLAGFSATSKGWDAATMDSELPTRSCG